MLATLRTYLEMIRFSHTVFALPFAFMGAILAAAGLPPWGTLGWILVAMVGARSGAMGMNRIADRHLDALNPRTRERALPQGRIALGGVVVFVVASFGIFLLAAWMLNPLCFALAPVAVLVVCGYSYTKRFTAGSHLVLGLSLALAPIGAWIAVTGSVALPALILGMGVLFWVAGFDILYAFMDIEFDRRTGLFSIPARFGMTMALVVAGIFHTLTIGFLALLMPLFGLGPIYGLGLACAAGLLLYEHLLVHRHGLAKLNMAFFNVNGVLGIGMFLATVGDLFFSR
ncbi:MAG: 4-hydroxybenzoate octaprenyltransferase [candidate division NC10 bacterium RBG_16_65_8]|nr:MAG: 4-hydroxybenzoate octaprenyltransferase [candidate division NC10 bacterium RBG_16_65_8]